MRPLYLLAVLILNVLLGVFCLAGHPASAQGASRGYLSVARYPGAVTAVQEDMGAVLQRTNPADLTPAAVQAGAAKLDERIRQSAAARGVQIPTKPVLEGSARAGSSLAPPQRSAPEGTKPWYVLKAQEEYLRWRAAHPKGEARQPAARQPAGGSQRQPRSPGSPPKNAPTAPAELQFDTIADTNTSAADGPLAAGPTNLVTAANGSNGALAVFDLTGANVLNTTLRAFFQPVVRAGAFGFLHSRASFDPLAGPAGDPDRGRFILMALEIDSGITDTSILLAVSQTSDASGAWNKYRFDANRPNGAGGLFPDGAERPWLGYDSAAIYVTFDWSQFPGNYDEFGITGNRLMTFNKTTAAAGGALTPVLIDDILQPAPNNSVLANGLRPAESLGNYSSTTGVMVATTRSSPSLFQGAIGVGLYRVTDPLGLLGPPVVTTAGLKTPSFFFGQDAPQAGSVFGITTPFDTQLQKTVIRNGIVWTCLGAAPVFFGKSQVTFIKIDPSGPGRIADLKTIGHASRHYYYPAIVPDDRGNAVAVFGGSDPNTFTTIFHARFNGTTNTFEQETVTKASTASYAFFGWGRYFDASPDVSGTRVWVHGMYASSAFTWQLHAAKVRSVSLSVVAPNGEETFLVGDNVNIQWTPGAADLLGVNIDVSRDGGLTYPESIAVGTPDTGSFTWTVTGPLTETAKIRVTAVSLASITDTSDDNFRIVDGFRTQVCTTGPPVVIPDNFRDDRDWVELSLVMPVEQIIKGIDVGVDITHGFVGDLQIFLVPPTVTDAVPAFNQMIMLQDTTRERQIDLNTTFPAPTRPAQTLHTLFGTRSTSKDPITGVQRPWRLRIRDLESGDVGQINKFCLTIYGPGAGQFAITFPNGGERFATGTVQNITWTEQFVTGDVKVEYSLDGGTTFIPIGTVPAGTLTIPWTVPNVTSNTARIKVSSVAEPTAFDISDANFRIVDPFLTVLSPNGGELVPTGKVFNITWDDEPRVGTVRIELSLDNGSTFNPIALNAPDTGTFAWTPMIGQETNQALIRIVSNPGSGAPRNDTSNAVFTILTPAIQVTAPNGGELWYTGTQRTITWLSLGVVGNVKIELFRNGAWETLLADTDNDGTETITVTEPAATDARVRVTLLSDSTFTDTSDAPFEIRSMSITVLNPNGGEVIGTGFPYTINWTSDGVPGNVNIELSRNDGMSFTTIAANVPNNGSFTTSFLAGATDLAVVRIQAVGFDAFDVSDSVFSLIDPGITILAANGGEELRVGLPFTILWTSAGIPATNVNIELSRNGGATWTPLFTNIPNDGSETWTVTPGDTTEGLFRITVSTNPGVSDTSDSAFNIVTPKLTVLAPNGGEQWVTGTSQVIRWLPVGFDGNVNIELTRNGGTTFETLFTNVENSGQINWTVTDPGSGNARVRITPISRPDLVDESDGPFTIVAPSITLGTPNGGEQWLIGTTQNITWVSEGVPSTANLDVEVSRDGGSTWSFLMTTVNDGSEAWAVTGDPSTNALIRLTWTDRRTIFDQSDLAFTIATPTLIVTAPANGTRWRIGSRQTISWTGTVLQSGGGTVDILLSRDGGNTYKTIITDTANDGSAAWLVTGPTTRKAKVRVIWRPLPSVRGQSGGLFRILR